MATQAVGIGASAAAGRSAPPDTAATLVAAHKGVGGAIDTKGLAADVKAHAGNDPKAETALSLAIESHLSPVDRGAFQSALGAQNKAGQAGAKEDSKEGIGSFFEGAVEGDFSQNDSWSKTAGQIAMSFVPVAGQIADARDAAAAINQIRNGQEGGWVNLGASVIGFVPGIGGFAKAAIRGGEHVAEGGARIATTALKHSDAVAETAGKVEKAIAKPAAAEAEKVVAKTTAKTESAAAKTETTAAKTEGKTAETTEKAATKVQTFKDADAFNKAADHAASNTRYEYEGFSYQTDAKGRVDVAEGVIPADFKATGRNDPALQTAIGKEGKTTDVGFHLIGDRFGGQTNRLNVVPGNGKPTGDGLANLNQGAYKHFENTVAELAQKNLDKKVEMRVEAQYKSGNASNRPDSFEASYRVNGGAWRTQAFVNK